MSCQQYRKNEKDSGNEGSSESDQDDNPAIDKKRSRPLNTFPKSTGYDFSNATSYMIPNTAFTETTSLDDFNSKARQFKEDRRDIKNNIWKDIAEEGMVTDIAASFFTGSRLRPDDALQHRGSDTEQYINQRLMKRKFGDRSHHHYYESDSEVSSDGLSDDSLEYVRAKRGKEQASVVKSAFAGGRAVSIPSTLPAIKATRLNDAADASAENGKKSSANIMDTESQPQKLTDQGKGNNDSGINDIENNCSSYELPETKKEIQDDEQKQPVERRKWKGVLEARFRRLDDKEFGIKMVQHLQERKNPGLILKAIDILGREECLRLLHKTLKIQRSGGIAIKKMTRMRTTGGTFLYLIRNDKKISSNKKEAVLHDEGPTKSTSYKIFEDIAQKAPNAYGGGITQRIMERHTGISQPRIDLESDKFSLPSNPVEEMEAAQKVGTSRTEISYNDLDLFDFEF